MRCIQAATPTQKLEFKLIANILITAEVFWEKYQWAFRATHEK